FGLSLTFVTSTGLFSVPATLGMPYKIEVFATSIFNFVERDSPDFNMAATLGMVVITVTILTFFIQRRLLLPREFTTVTGKGFRPNVIDLGRWGYLTFSFQVLYLCAAVGLPIAALLIVSISQTWLGSPDFSKLTHDHFAYVLFRYPLTQRGIWNSIFLATVGASAGMAICFVLAYCIHRSQGKGKAILDFVVSLPIGMPAVVLSMGILLAYIRTPLYKTIWIILLAYITRYIPVGVKNVSSVLMAISQELEDSSRMCGAAWLTTVRRIFMPLIKPGLLAGWLTLFLIFMRELNASILLYTDGTGVMSVILYLLLQDAVAPQIAAYAMIQTAMTLAIVWLIRKLVLAEEVG
ncbi:MAG: iron ABC transporter permease, partial [Candidatus Tectomicrobia bacterium]|nr:iron ABC transporter permease [Candidatus Tectomicrobia bacterium]